MYKYLQSLEFRILLINFNSSTDELNSSIDMTYYTLS